MDPKGKSTTPVLPYRRCAKRGYLPSNDLPHAGLEPSGKCLVSIFVGKHLDGSRGSLCHEDEGTEYKSDMEESDDESIYDPGVGPLSMSPMESSNEWCIVATFKAQLGITCQIPECLEYDIMHV